MVKSLIFKIAPPLVVAACGCWLTYAYFNPPVPIDFPPLVASPNPVELGRMKEGRIDVKVRLVNTTAQPLKLHSVERSCRCTDVSIPKKVLPPEESIECTCVWNTDGMRGPALTTFSVFFSEGDTVGIKNCEVLLRADVAPRIPTSVNEIRFLDEGESTIAVEFSSLANQGLTLYDAVVDANFFDVTLVNERTVSVKFSPERRKTDRQHFTFVAKFSGKNGDERVTLPVSIPPSSR